MFEETRLFEETITPLAKQITKYIRDHEDNVAQEKRWRTSMKRDISKNFRMQHEVSTTTAKNFRKAANEQRELVDSQFNKQREEMQAMHSKLDQLVERLANQREVHIHAAC